MDIDKAEGHEIPSRYKVRIVTVSDTCHHQEKTDVSGTAMAGLLASEKFFAVTETLPGVIVPDEKEDIEAALIKLADEEQVDLILTIGGTGFSPRDVTPEATLQVCERQAPALVQTVIASSFETTMYSVLSRATCGIRGRTIILNLPGNVKGSQECFSRIAAVLPHAMDQLRGDDRAVAKCHAGPGISQPKKSVKPIIKIFSGQAKPKEGLMVEKKHSRCKIGKVALRPRESPYPMKTVEDALAIVLLEFEPLDVVIRKFNECVGFIAAVDVCAVFPSPPFRASIKDGYALCVGDGVGTREVLSVLTAGDSPEENCLHSHGCVRVSTGAPVPTWAEAVVQVEDTFVTKRSSSGDIELEINVFKEFQYGQDIREIGSDIEKGEIILPRGKCITSFDSGTLVSAGVTEISVHGAPKVAVLSTGDELVSPGSAMGPGGIYDSNKVNLLSMLQKMNLICYDCGIAKDNPDDLRDCLEKAFRNSDVTIVSGGVSMGEKDILKDVLQVDFGAKIHFGRVHMKPGKPTTFATADFESKKKFIFCLPGNPVSAVVTFHLFVVPSLRKMMGHKILHPVEIKAKLYDDVILDPRPEYHRACVTWQENGEVIARSTGSQRSSRLLSLTGANALMVLPAKCDEKNRLNKNEEVYVMLLDLYPEN